MAIIGETLAVPEYGFTRYELINKDDLTLNNEYFYSIGTFITQDTNGLLAVGVSNGNEILVKIKNTYNFRLLVCLPSSTNANTLYTNNMVVEIDGVKHTFDLTSNRNTTIIDNCLAVDIKNLSTNSHIVKIYADGNNNDTQMINVQAIDIDTKGIIGFTRTMASMFEGCANLKKDIIIPKNADVVENMFKNCTSMTHVHSNWDETYNDSGIITEDCYSGCTSITHIDDVALSLNEYSNGLDNIPSEWGGYGFSKEYTGIYMVEILSPNYTFSFASDGLLDNGYINWGDGTTTKNEYSHTYVNAGVYIIKGKVHSPAETVTDSMKLCLKEVIQYPIYGNLSYAFSNCTALISANISGNKCYYITRGRTSVFSGCTNLERVIALDTKLEKAFSHIAAFQNCKKLREIIGIEDFIYNTHNLMSCFNNCSSLPNFILSEDALKNCISLYQAFNGCKSLTESPIKTFVSNSDSLSIGRMFMGCTNITDISGVTFGENITNADNWYPPNLTTANNVTIKNKNNVVNFRDCTYLTECNNLTLANNVTDISGLFSGCSSLKQDIIIPYHITNCSEMFKNCTSMTHIRSNWNNSYTNGITATDCYSGCTAVTHIDDKNVIAYEGDTGIDYVPVEWGGNGFSKSNTSILRINLTSDNYNVCISTTTPNDGVTSWGDGTADTSMEHTYSTAGTYILKTQKKINTASNKITLRNVLTDILGISNTPIETEYHIFRECLKLKTVNIDNHILKNRPIEPLFYGSRNIEYVSAKNVTVKKSGFGCASSGILYPSLNNVLTEIVGIDTWKIETNDLSYLFKGYAKLESLDISNWNLENVTNMGNMFEWCESLTEPPIENLPNSVSNISNMFKNCISLTHDIEIPPNVTNCSGMFKDCTSMTHIRSNWNNSYNYEITATDCYSGCTAITHIDDKNVIAYEGDAGLDYVPVEWGGNGLTDDGTMSILEVTIPSDNFALKLFVHNYNFSRRDSETSQSWDKISFNNRVNWGDGEVYKNDNSNGSDAFPTHTYARAGVYYIKGHFGRFGQAIKPTTGTYDFNSNAKYLITKVLKWAYLGRNDATNAYNETNLGYSFAGLSSVKSVSGLKVTNKIANLSGLFQNCASLISIDFSGCDTSNVTNIEYMFNGCSSLTSLDLSSLNMSKVTNMRGMFYNCKSFTESPIVNFPNSVTNISDMFNGCSSLTHDIEIPSHITNSSNMFQGCTSMTHIRSNWNNSYTNGITATDCYSGCTAVTHIDDKNIIAYEGDVGIDYVPSEWGGNGFTKSNTTILRIYLPSNDYNVCLCTIDQTDGVTSWGDGTTDGSMAHTYSTAGTYILKTQKTIITPAPQATLREVLTDILSLSNSPLGGGGNSPHHFRRCENLKTVNMDDYVLISPSHTPLFYDSYNVEYISAKNVTIKGSGFGCTTANYVENYGNNILTEIVGVDTWKIETNDISHLFNGFYKLKSLNISNWNLENVTNMSNMFDCCRSLTEPPIKNLPNSVSNISNMFKGCISLTHDIEIPPNVTNCSGMFQGCTSMTHIRSNWDNSYIGAITSTDCYSGCTGITHCDEIDLGVNEYIKGLDEVPPSWGGYGLHSDYTTIAEFDIDEANLTFDLTTDASINLFDDKIVVWGDGAVTYGETRHTYTTTGKYVIKGKYWFANINLSWAKRITKIIKVPYNVPINTFFCFCGSTLLEYANFTNAILKNASATFNMYNTNNKSILKTIIIKNTRVQKKVNIDKFFSANPALEEIDVSGFVFEGNHSIESMFDGCENLAIIRGLETWTDGSKFNNTRRMFCGCSSMTSLDLSGFNTSSVTNMSNMFEGCSNLTSLVLSGFNTSSVTNTSNMFYGCSSLTNIDLSSFDTGSVTIMPNIFNGCKNLTSVDMSMLDLSKVTDMSNMFKNCSNLTFLDLSGFNTSSVTNMSNMFEGCKNLTSVDMSMLDLSKVTNMNYMLYGCSNLKYWSGVPTTDNKISMDAILMNTNIETIGLSDFSKVCNTYAFTRNCTTLKNIEIVPLSIDLDDDSYSNWGITEIWRFGTVLTDASLTQILNGLADKTGKDTVSIDFSSCGYLVRLTAEQIAIATNKNYTLV